MYDIIMSYFFGSGTAPITAHLVKKA